MNKEALEALRQLHIWLGRIRARLRHMANCAGQIGLRGMADKLDSVVEALDFGCDQLLEDVRAKLQEQKGEADED